MTDRIVTDSAGRSWTCSAETTGGEATATNLGRDVVLVCATPSVAEPVRLTVGWQWEKISPNGLARLISQASPVPRR